MIPGKIQGRFPSAFECVWLCAQSSLALCDPKDHSPPGSSVHGILQARIREWLPISYSRASSRASDWTCFSCISCIGRWILYHWAIWEAKRTWKEGLPHSWDLSFPWENQVVWSLFFLSCPKEQVQNIAIALCTKLFIVLLMPVKTPILERIALPMPYLGATRLVLRILHSA